VQFAKYHALGNDYLVVEPAEVGDALSPDRVRLICERHRGVGSDGLLVGPYDRSEVAFGLRLFNPDGSEFEKSGNGLRIFARFLHDRDLVGFEPFTIHTPGGVVTARVHPGAERVTVDMGRVSFDSRHIPVLGPPREVLDEAMVVAGQTLRFSAATMGNPHCVLRREEVCAAEAQRLGPLIERDPRFPNRTNVQFVRVLDRGSLQLEIWERGVGYTLASGSSSCAAAAVAHRLGWCDAQVVVQMPGGSLDVVISADGSARMSGAVTKVCEGRMAPEMFGGDRPGVDTAFVAHRP
jgi:diaminopimelate epimerase